MVKIISAVKSVGIKGVGNSTENLRALKNKERREFSEFSTRRLVLEAWDKLEAGELH